MLTAVLCALALAGVRRGRHPAPVAQTPEATAAALKVDRFDEDRAWRMLEHQVNLGPRPAGSEQSRKLAAYIKARLPRGRYENLPGGLRNVVGAIPGKGKPILLAAHYDTKDIDGFVGANDGAGGTAALLEIARVLEKTKRARERAADPLHRVRRRGGRPTTTTSTAPACAAPRRTRASTRRNCARSC